MDGTLKQSEYGHAWVEVDLDALAFNALQLKKLLPETCELMAVVKTDAYGHGAKRVAMRLQTEGVRAFAVATAGEGVELREAGLEGEILVLGYTHKRDAGLLGDYSLTQLIVDGAHAAALDGTGFRLDVHIAVDTGMHRLGIDASNPAEIESVFKCRNLTVRGLATHFASSDSLLESDIEFTNLQMERYRDVVDALKEKGYDAGKLHAQASFGILNYPEIKCDYARAGIALYGVMSHNVETVAKPLLKPVLSLKALVAQVRWIGAGESVSYGRAYRSGKPIRIATVCIGYSDGVPRQMSGNGGVCLVSRQKVPIIGRICMDLLMIDVTGVDTVKAGDVVTLIGCDGAGEIRCEDVAEASGTISNDILCRLGKRLPRVYLE